MAGFDSRTLATPVYQSLDSLRKKTRNDTQKSEQKGQAVELYTYLSTWGLMRLKAEEVALSQQGKKEVVLEFFKCLQQVSGQQNLTGDVGLKTLTDLKADDYLGLTGLALSLAQEFSFWGNAIYVKEKDPS
ncbi:MAG: hypothetical protein MH825_15485 [Cyanobacteria bacterium]|nr:hypothetical protein [Cyanobacteriota bacterium]